MCLVSEFRDVKGSMVNMGKHTRLRVRQVNFKAVIQMLPTEDIMMLDYRPKLETDALRELIMEIGSTNHPETPNIYFRQ